MRQNPCSESCKETQKWGKVLPLTQKVFVTDPCWKRENRLAPRRHRWEYEPHSSAGPSEHNTGSIFRELFVLFYYFLPIDFLFFYLKFARFDFHFGFVVGFYFFEREEEKEHAVGWAGVWEGSVRSWEREKKKGKLRKKKENGSEFKQTFIVMIALQEEYKWIPPFRLLPKLQGQRLQKTVLMTTSEYRVCV